jgi:hypothetical protein
MYRGRRRRRAGRRIRRRGGGGGLFVCNYDYHRNLPYFPYRFTFQNNVIMKIKWRERSR